MYNKIGQQLLDDDDSDYQYEQVPVDEAFSQQGGLHLYMHNI
jgi:hypothetical protein